MKPVRSFTALDLVRLPRVDANDAQSLGRAVLVAAEGQALTDGAKEALIDVAAALDVVVEASTRKLPGTGNDTGPGTREADANLDAAWSATYDFLTGWSKLGNEPKAKVAAELRERLYPDGLKFTKIRFTKQWAESNTRLSLIDEGSLEASFEALGGKVFLDTIRTTHRTYGDVLGITKAQEDPVQAERIRDALLKLADALRAYVLQVSAMARKSDPASQALVDKLLAPITHWQSPPVGKGSTTPTTPEPQMPAEPGEGSCGS